VALSSATVVVLVIIAIIVIILVVIIVVDDTDSGGIASSIVVADFALRALRGLLGDAGAIVVATGGDDAGLQIADNVAVALVRAAGWRTNRDELEGVLILVAMTDLKLLGSVAVTIAIAIAIAAVVTPATPTAIALSAATPLAVALALTVPFRLERGGATQQCPRGSNQPAQQSTP
jgi:hypothetical protein